MRRDGVRRLPIVPQQRSYRDLPIETEVTERVMPLRKVCPSEMLYDGMRRLLLSVPQQRSYRHLPIESEVTERVMLLRKIMSIGNAIRRGATAFYCSLADFGQCGIIPIGLHELLFSLPGVKILLGLFYKSTGDALCVLIVTAWIMQVALQQFLTSRYYSPAV